MIGVILAILSWIGCGAISLMRTGSLLRYELLCRQVEEERARLVKRVSEWETPEVSPELRAKFGELAARNSVTSSALRERGRLVADELRAELEFIPDVTLAAIIGCLTGGLEGVEGIACREQLDSLDLVRIIFTAAAAELAAVELETAG